MLDHTLRSRRDRDKFSSLQTLENILASGFEFLLRDTMFDSCFFSRWLWSLWRVPRKEAVGIQALLYPSFLVSPAVPTDLPPLQRVARWHNRLPVSAVCPSDICWKLRVFSTSKPVHQRQLLGLSCDQIRQPEPHGMSVQGEGPCQERGHAISLRSCVYCSGCRLVSEDVFPKGAWLEGHP